MSSPYQIIRAGLDHLDQAAVLFDSYRQFYKQEPALDICREFLAARLEQGQSVVFLAVDPERDRHAVGFAQLFPSFTSVSLGTTWILNDLYVDPEARRVGIAKLLIAESRTLARATGAQWIGLSTAIDNTNAQALYESLGFVRDENFYRYYLSVK